MMEDTQPNSANGPELDHWLSLKSRCFGDKGDVEDITEGEPSHLEMVPPLESCLLT